MKPKKTPCRWLVWLSRIRHVWGFGIQSPSDYDFVRHVINEHAPYYAYGKLRGDDWLTRKLGRLYLRLANWRQPHTMAADRYQRYWQAGCRQIRFGDTYIYNKVELVRIDIADDYEALFSRCDAESVVVVEGLWRDKQRWQALQHDARVGTTFDLYYCGIVLFDKQRYPHHYIVNF